jgi:hypothetical protein
MGNGFGFPDNIPIKPIPVSRTDDTIWIGGSFHSHARIHPTKKGRIFVESSRQDGWRNQEEEICQEKQGR